MAPNHSGCRNPTTSLEQERYCAQFLEEEGQESANPPASPCGARKLPEPARAGQLYTGSYHQICRRAAAVAGATKGLDARTALGPRSPNSNGSRTHG